MTSRRWASPSAQRTGDPRRGGPRIPRRTPPILGPVIAAKPLILNGFLMSGWQNEFLILSWSGRGCGHLATSTAASLFSAPNPDQAAGADALVPSERGDAEACSLRHSLFFRSGSGLCSAFLYVSRLRCAVLYVSGLRSCMCPVCAARFCKGPVKAALFCKSRVQVSRRAKAPGSIGHDFKQYVDYSTQGVARPAWAA